MTRARDVANVLSTATDLATDTETAAAISSHNSATTSVHGITNTANLATQASIAASYATKGALNYTQTLGTKVTGISGASSAIVSASITTTGYPVHIVVTGDAENNGAGAWARLQLFRGSTAIGNKVHVEGSAGSENIPFTLQFIDSQAAGAYTYSLRTLDTAGGTFNFGETDGPTITLLELGK